MKFLTDRSLGRLTKWLRLLGYDTESYPGDADRSFLNKARSEGRVALTRKRALGKRQFMGEMLILEADLVEDQLRYVISHFSLEQEQQEGHAFSRCLKCNERLVHVDKENVKKRVPAYTFETFGQFMTCPRCGSAYWPGTHKERAEDFIRKRILTGRP